MVATIVFPSVKPADILATLGVGSIAIGFACKDILQSWLAGLLLLIRQPFRQGDQIVVGKQEGTVERIEARATVIRTYDGKRVIIPNRSVYTESVTVHTAFHQRRSEYDVGIGYGEDVRKACGVIRHALRDIPGLAADPAPEAIPWELAGSTVNTPGALVDQAAPGRRGACPRAGDRGDQAGAHRGRGRPAVSDQCGAPA